MFMSAKLQNLLERIAALPNEWLDEVQESVDEIEPWRGDVLRLTDDERAAVRRGMEAARRGDFVTDEELAAFIVAIADKGSHHAAGARRS
jgi:predicted transcriptional regulator